MHSQSLTPEVDMQNVIALLTNTFRIPVGTVTLYAIPTLESAIRGIGNCEEVVIRDQYYERVHRFINLNRNRQPLSNEQLNCLMENVKPSVDFKLTVGVEQGSRCDKGLHCDKILIHEAHWMTRTSLLNTRAAFLQLYKGNHTGKDFIDFVKQWMDSEDTKLQCVLTSGNDALTGFENHGLPIMPFDETRRAKMH